jgi:hypothetical protein
MKYGLEKELFILKNNVIQMVPKNSELPFDESGVLIEARGKPSDNIIEAVYNLKAEEYRITKIANNLEFITSDIPIMQVTRDFKREVRRNYTKGLISFQNMYNYKDNRHSQNEITAAVHISFTNPKSRIVNLYIGKDSAPISEKIIWNEYFDFIKYVKALDKAFKEEIKQSKRNPGFYEVKPDGRVEYRSLPSNVNLNKIIEVIQEIK